MAIIQWSNALALGIVEIDEQHQKLIAIINELNDAMVAGKGKTILAQVIENLIHYTKTHFALEEKYFAQFHYSGTTAHKREHTEFVRKVHEFQNNFQTGKMGLSTEVMSFLREWLTTHIQVTDKQYIAVFIENGVK